MITLIITLKFYHISDNKERALTVAKAKDLTAKQRKKALVLSGGGSRGAYQIGAWRALAELGWTFDMVIGVSVGSLNGAMVVQDQRILAENLWREFETGHIFDVSNNAQPADFALEFIKQGGAGTKGLKKVVKRYLDEEAVRKSPVDYGLLVVDFPSLKPHYLWKKDIPIGKMGDYIMASSSAFPALQVYEIDGKKYADGGLENVLPIHMAVEKGATDIVAIYLDAAGRFDKSKELASAKDTNLTLIQAKWDLGNFLLFDKENTLRIMQLGYQDTMKAFNVYEGDYFTFIKGDIDRKDLRGADAAAKIFDLDSTILYSKEKLLMDLGESVSKSAAEFAALITAGRQAFRGGNFDLKLARDFFVSSNKKVAALLIARDINDNKESSIFINRYALRIVGEEVAAARFLQKNGLL